MEDDKEMYEAFLRISKMVDIMKLMRNRRKKEHRMMLHPHLPVYIHRLHCLLIF